MKTATKILFLSTFFMSLFLQAGGSVGNGGDVMLCKKTDGTVKSIELLDYYESRILRKINVNLGADQLSPQEKVQLVLKRIEKFSPRRYTKYRDWAESFIADTNFVNNANLVDVPDSEIPFFPDGCKLEQIAIQKAPTFPEDKRYLVNSDIWEQLDNNGKAGLILHEIIYREAIELGQSNSKGVRYFNSVISSLLVEQMTTVQFIKLISSAGFNYVETGNLELTEVEFYPDGQISEAKVLSGSLLINGKAIEIEKDISYYPDGSVKSAVLKSNADIAVGGQTLSFSAGRVEFYENGNLKQAYPSCAKDAKKTYTGSNYIINLTTNCVTRSIAKFHSNGKPESFQQMEGVIKSAYGQLKIAQEVRFNSDGQIEFAKTKSGVKNEYRIGNTLYDISDDYNIWFVNFYADGAIDAIKGIDIKSPKTITIQNFALPVDDNLEFHQNGAVQVMRINNQVLRRQDGTLKYYKGIQRVEFDLNGFVIDDEVNLSMDLISLDTFTNDVILSAKKTCGLELADQLWSQAFPESCNKSEKTEHIYITDGFKVENFCKKDEQSMSLEFADSGRLWGVVNDTWLLAGGSPASLRYKLITPNEQFDDLGNQIKGVPVSEFLVIDFPTNYESIVKFFNAETKKETKLKLDLNAYVECLKTQLQF